MFFFLFKLMHLVSQSKKKYADFHFQCSKSTDYNSVQVQADQQPDYFDYREWTWTWTTSSSSLINIHISKGNILIVYWNTIKTYRTVKIIGCQNKRISSTYFVALKHYCAFSIHLYLVDGYDFYDACRLYNLLPFLKSVPLKPGKQKWNFICLIVSNFDK